MKKTMLALSTAAIVAISASAASAQATRVYSSPAYANTQGAAALTGAAVGTAVGVGLYNGWYGGSFASALPSSAAGAAATGFVAGVGAVALTHAATTPCQGFHAMFGNLLTSSRGCVNGRYVGTY